MAAVVIAAAGFPYLRPTAAPKQANVPSSVSPQFVSTIPVAHDFISPSMGWASLIFVPPSSQDPQFRVFRTVDGAKHWQLQLSGPSRSTGLGFSPITVQFFGKTRGFIVVGEPVEQLYRTADGGARWDSVSLPPSARIDNVAFSDASNGWVLAAPLSPLPAAQLKTGPQALRLYATRDGGNSWERLADPPVDASSLDFRRPTEAWIGGFGPGPPHVYNSSDAGQSWQRHDLPAPAGGAWTADRFFPTFPTSIQLLPNVGAFATVEAIRCLVVSTSSGAATCVNATSDIFVFASVDGGITWKRMPHPPGSIAYQDSVHWWATNADALMKSADAGQSWRQVATMPAGWQFLAAGILDSKHAWSSLFLVGGYGLALTSDGGLHWTLAKVPQPT